MKPYILSPDKTPMENLWDCIEYCCKSMLKQKKLRLKHDERDELLIEWAIRAFIAFKRRVITGNYDRNYALWQNVFYCCWGTWVRSWIPAKRVIVNKINTVSLDERLIIPSSVMENEGSTRVEMVSDSIENKLNYEHKYNPREQRHDKLNIPEQRDNAYDLYLEECYDLGVTPVDMETYVVRNGGKPEWADPNRTYRDYINEHNREHRTKRRAWGKQWYERHKHDDRYKQRKHDYYERHKAKTSESTSQSST